MALSVPDEMTGIGTFIDEDPIMTANSTAPKFWQKLSQSDIQTRVLSALDQNVSYLGERVIGVPGSYLDPLVFDKDVPFLRDAPFLQSLLENPNHIGCHTLGNSEPFFEGTHAIEKELLDVCAVDILKSESGAYDGYVASGGTEANIQAIWVYRNYFQQEFQAKNEEILVLCSQDSHYSMDKACNVLSLDIARIPVNLDTRAVEPAALDDLLVAQKNAGKKYVIMICNMMTTMFGSVDETAGFVSAFKAHNLTFRLHVDGAYGGFYYPFSTPNNPLNFTNPDISSFTLDAHKMAQAPYGTGIFLIRKGLIHYANTQEAKYVKGEDYTLVGSRSGANAISVWMILSSYGCQGWHEKIERLQLRTDELAQNLRDLGLEFFQTPRSNIITIKDECIDRSLAEKYFLVPDDHTNPKWQKIVVMEHVDDALIGKFVNELKV